MGWVEDTETTGFLDGQDVFQEAAGILEIRCERVNGALAWQPENPGQVWEQWLIPGLASSIALDTDA